MNRNFIIRALVIAGTLFFFIDCAGSVKSDPWVFDDAQALAVRILDAEQWLEKSKRDFTDIKKIINRKLKRYLNTDIKIHNELEINLMIIKRSVTEADSITKIIRDLHAQLRDTSIDSLDSQISDSSLSYRESFKSHSEQFDISKKTYLKSIKKIKNAFRRDRKKMIFIEDEYAHYKNTLLELRYKRQALAPRLEQFNSALHSAFFDDNRSPKAKKIRLFSKQIEQYSIRMNRYEKFLSNIDKIALEEVNGQVILISRKSKPFKFKTRYKNGRDDYKSILKKMKFFFETTL
ncbi:MAG: hypothetical protein ACJZ12_00535 [Candidatus Neomarinimicrobiota bacterium]